MPFVSGFCNPYSYFPLPFLLYPSYSLKPCGVQFYCYRAVVKTESKNTEATHTRRRSDWGFGMKYIVWMHKSDSVSTGTLPMSGRQARQLLKEEQRAIMQPDGCLPEWPKFEIRKADNPPRGITKAKGSQ